MKNYYNIDEHYWENSSTQVAKLHSHHEYELYMYLEGDCYYVVDGKKYDLTRGDIIIIRRHEMHRVFHRSAGVYRSVVLFLSPEFFSQNNCQEYEKAFLEYGKDNKIDSETVYSSGLQDALNRLKKYSKNYVEQDSPIVKSLLIEIAYLINNIQSFEKPTKSNQSIREIIAFINANYKAEISLETLADKFFISKYHLCRVFKQATGLTVQEYVRRKRLTLALELKNDGMTLLEAASVAGFKDYSSFYRYYRKRYKNAPKSANI